MTNVKATLADAVRLARPPKFISSRVDTTGHVRHRARLTQIRADLGHCVGGPLAPFHPQARACRHDRLRIIATTAARPFVFMTRYRD
jgi:hypothetical protein